MPVYTKKALVTSPRFSDRVSTILSAGPGGVMVKNIRVPDSVVLCCGCNRNLCEDKVIKGEIPFGYLVYLGKRELKANQPYDIYCSDCVKRYFPKAMEVVGEVSP